MPVTLQSQSEPRNRKAEADSRVTNHRSSNMISLACYRCETNQRGGRMCRIGLKQSSHVLNQREERC